MLRLLIALIISTLARFVLMISQSLHGYEVRSVNRLKQPTVVVTCSDCANDKHLTCAMTASFERGKTMTSISRNSCKVLRALATVGAIALTGMPLSSSALVLTSGTTTVGNQAFSGAGLSFHVNSAITVSQLGVFDSAPDGITGGAQLWATLFNAANGNVLAAIDFTQADAGSLSNLYRYKSISPLTLAVGDYVLAGFGWDANNLEYNTQNGAGNTVTFNPDGSSLVTFNHTRYGVGPGIDGHTVMPVNIFGPHAFNAANMVFEAGSTVPEPTSLALLVFGLAGLGFSRRKRA